MIVCYYFLRSLHFALILSSNQSTSFRMIDKWVNSCEKNICQEAIGVKTEAEKSLVAKKSEGSLSK